MSSSAAPEAGNVEDPHLPRADGDGPRAAGRVDGRDEPRPGGEPVLEPGAGPMPERHGARSEAELVAAAVLAVPGVAGLHGGTFGEVATYLPGRRVHGVRFEPDDARAHGGPGRVEVHVVVRYPTPIATVAARIRTRLAPLTGDRAVDVHVEDYGLDDEAPDGSPRPDRPGR